jgi:sec-independent protein translocase protein TatC
MVVAGILIVVLGLSVGTWHIQDHHDSARVDRGVRSYFLVLPAAAKFLLNFNDSQFNVQVQAKQYYSFFATTLLACGIVFQVPVGILSVTRLGIVKVEQLTKNRRYAYLVCAVVAAALPGIDPISMLLEMAPLVVLYEVSILLAKAFGTPAERVDAEPLGS